MMAENIRDGRGLKATQPGLHEGSVAETSNIINLEYGS
jgi:hypothetical protein